MMYCNKDGFSDLMFSKSRLSGACSPLIELITGVCLIPGWPLPVPGDWRYFCRAAVQLRSASFLQALASFRLFRGQGPALTYTRAAPASTYFRARSRIKDPFRSRIGIHCL
jgi:hypothetical protein